MAIVILSIVAGIAKVLISGGVNLLQPEFRKLEDRLKKVLAGYKNRGNS